MQVIDAISMEAEVSLMKYFSEDPDAISVHSDAMKANPFICSVAKVETLWKLICKSILDFKKQCTPMFRADFLFLNFSQDY